MKYLFWASFGFALGLPSGLLMAKYEDKNWIESQRVARLCAPYVPIRSPLSGNLICDFLVKYAR